MANVALAEIETRLNWVLASPNDSGHVTTLVVRPAVNQREMPGKAMFSPQLGVACDNWSTSCWKKLPDGKSDPEVQVAIMNARMIEVLTKDNTLWPLAGDQLFVDFDLSVANLKTGDQLQVGAAVLEITAESHQGCNKFKQRFGENALAFVNSTLGDAHRLRGVYAKIISAGEVCVDDTMTKINQ